MKNFKNKILFFNKSLLLYNSCNFEENCLFYYNNPIFLKFEIQNKTQILFNYKINRKSLISENCLIYNISNNNNFLIQNIKCENIKKDLLITILLIIFNLILFFLILLIFHIKKFIQIKNLFCCINKVDIRFKDLRNNPYVQQLENPIDLS